MYREIREAGVGGYADEVDLLHKTIGFYAFAEKRLAFLLPSMESFLATHFSARWGIARNLYRIAMENQRRYLEKILAVPEADPRQFLRREGIVDRLRNSRRRKYHYNVSQKQKMSPLEEGQGGVLRAEPYVAATRPARSNRLGRATCSCSAVLPGFQDRRRIAGVVMVASGGRKGLVHCRLAEKNSP